MTIRKTGHARLIKLNCQSPLWAILTAGSLPGQPSGCRLAQQRTCNRPGV